MLRANTDPVPREMPKAVRRRLAAVPAIRLPIERAVLVGDLASTALALAAMAYALDTGLSEGLVMVAGMLGLFLVKGHYAVRSPFVSEAKQILMTTALALTLILSFRALVGETEPNAGLVWFAVVVATLLIAGRVTLKYLLHRAGAWRVPTVAVGAAASADELRRVIDRDWYVGHVVDDIIATTAPDEEVTAELDHRLLSRRARHVIIVVDPDNCRAAQCLIEHLEHRSPTTYSLVPPISGLPFAQLRVLRLFGHDGIVLDRWRSGPSWHVSSVKRLIDVVLSIILLVLLCPLLLVISAVVRMDGGPVIYGSARIGQGGREFKAYKFRTMVPDADETLKALLASDPVLRDEWQTRFKLARDPRITPIGRFLRRASLDELPQLINVLKGEMSLVGPRPILPDERDIYGQNFALYSETKPGITGMWQVCGRNEIDYLGRIRLNNWYFKNGTIWNDLSILLRTVKVVLGRIGAS